MDKKVQEYRNRHPRCRYCKYCNFILLKWVPGCPGWYSCSLKDKYICSDMSLKINWKGMFCRWYETKIEDGDKQ